MSDTHDRLIHFALEPARRLEPTDAEVAVVLRRLARRSPRMPVMRTVAIAIVGAVLAAAGAGAATGVLPIGSVLRGEGFTSGADDQTVKETVLASGATHGAGRWRITAFETDRGVRCLKLALLDARQRSIPGPRSSGYCGGVAGFTAFSHGRNAAAARRGEVLLFGRAPARARSVELVARDGTRLRAATQTGATGVPGSHWLIAAPNGLDRPTLRWIDADGREHGGIDVSYRFSGPVRPAIVMRGRTHDGGRWKLKAYESRRHQAGGDIYEPEGLPCMTLFLLDRHGRSVHGSGGCGEFPKAPGFAKYQASILNEVGRPVRVFLFGRAPQRANAVELVSNGGRTRMVSPRPAPPGGQRTKYWLMRIRPAEAKDAEVRWLDGAFRGDSIRVFPN